MISTKYFARFAVVSMPFALAACVTVPPYVPPSSGPVAALKIEMNNAQGKAQLFDMPPDYGITTSNKLILENKAASGPAHSVIQVQAAQPLYMTYNDFVPETNTTCNIGFSFVPAAGDNDELYVGDTPPTVGKGFWAKLEKGPEFGARCYVLAFRQLPDGQVQRIHVAPWKPYALMHY